MLISNFRLNRTVTPYLGLALLFGLLSPCASGAPAPQDVQRWDTLMLESVKALKSNRLDDAIARCDEALAMATNYGPPDTHLARSQVLRAEIYMWQKQNGAAEQTFHAAVASCEKAVGPRHPEMVHPLSSLANFYYFVVVRYDQVEPLFARILDIVEHAPNRDSHQEIVWSRNLGMLRQQMGKFDLAEPLFRRAVTLAAETEGDWEPHELLTCADFYRAWGKHEPAREFASRAVAIREHALAAAPANVDAKLDLAVALDEVAAIDLGARKIESAVAIARRSLALVESFMAPDQTELTPRLTGLAAALHAQGKFGEAATLYQRALTLTQKNLGPQSPELADLLTRYAALLTDMKRPDEARVYQTRAETIRRGLPVL